MSSPVSKSAWPYHYFTSLSIYKKGKFVFTSPNIRVVVKSLPFNHCLKSNTRGSRLPPSANQTFCSFGKYADVWIVPAQFLYLPEKTPLSESFNKRKAS